MQWKTFFAVAGASGLTLLARQAFAQTYTDVLDSNNVAAGDDVQNFNIYQVVVGANGQVGALIENDYSNANHPNGVNSQTVYYATDSTSTLTVVASSDPANGSSATTGWGSASGTSFLNFSTLAVSQPGAGAGLLTFEANTQDGSTGVFQFNSGTNGKSSLLFTGDQYPAGDTNSSAGFATSQANLSTPLSANSSGAAIFPAYQVNNSTTKTTNTIAYASAGGSSTSVIPGYSVDPSAAGPMILTNSGVAVFQQYDAHLNPTEIDQAGGAPANGTIGLTGAIKSGSLGLAAGDVPTQLLAAANVGSVPQVQTLFVGSDGSNTDIYVQKGVGNNVTPLVSAAGIDNATLLGAVSGNGNIAFTVPTSDGSGGYVVNQLDLYTAGSNTSSLTVGTLVNDPNSSGGTQTLANIETSGGPLLVNNNGIVLFTGDIDNGEQALLAWNTATGSLTAVAEAGDQLTIQSPDGSPETVDIQGLLLNYSLQNLATASNGNLSENDIVAFGVQYSDPLDSSLSGDAVLTTSLAVPEPVGGALFIGAAALLMRRRRKA